MDGWCSNFTWYFRYSGNVSRLCWSDFPYSAKLAGCEQETPSCGTNFRCPVGSQPNGDVSEHYLLHIEECKQGGSDRNPNIPDCICPFRGLGFGCDGQQSGWCSIKWSGSVLSLFDFQATHDVQFIGLCIWVYLHRVYCPSYVSIFSFSIYYQAILICHNICLDLIPISSVVPLILYGVRASVRQYQWPRPSTGYGNNQFPTKRLFSRRSPRTRCWRF